MQALIQARLRQADELTDFLGPQRVVQNWPVAQNQQVDEWSTKALRDAVYGSPRFVRLLNPESLRLTVAQGVREGAFGLGAKDSTGFVRVVIDEDLPPEEVEFSDDVVLLLPEVARRLKEEPATAEEPVLRSEDQGGLETAPAQATASQAVIFTGEKVQGVRWEGELPWQKWQLFYSKILSGLAREHLRITVRFESHPEGGLLRERVQDLREGLSELGLDDRVETDDSGGEG
jgi:hypothetical protein